MKKVKTITVIAIFSTILLVIVGLYAFNYLKLQSPMNKVIKGDKRNNGIEVSVHFENYINTSILIYDLKNVSGSNTMVDVFRVLLQFANEVKEREFIIVKLSFRGDTKFLIEGDYFQKIGEEYPWQNPVYSTRTFPENLLNIDGSRAYGQWTGGILGVLGKQMEDFNDFNEKWYLDDLRKVQQ